MRKLTCKVALVTGASRGIGARVAITLAEWGADVVINYRSKGARAEEVAAAVRAAGRRALLAPADITSESEVRGLVDTVKEQLGGLDYLILNASGGLEKNKPADYPFELNVTAQTHVVDCTLLLLRPGGRIVFVTSHLAHFHGQRPVYPAYEPVAASKKAGEEALRRRIPELADRGISLIVVSGDLIEGTITPRLLDRSQPGLIEFRREQAGSLPSVDEFALAIVEAAANDQLESGVTVFVGNRE